MAYPASPVVNITEVDLTTIVPGVSTSTGAIAGVFPWGPVGTVTLVSDETQLANTFGAPTSLNPETFFTASSFLGYSQALLVVRGANTTTNTVNSALNAIGNTTAANVVNAVVKSDQDFIDNRQGNLDPNAIYIARYPGDIGNSLKVFVCDSVNSYSSNLNLVFSNATVLVNGAVTVAIGSNNAALTFIANTTVADANTFATSVAAGITNGDILTFGNTTIGYQKLQVSSMTQSTNSSAATITLGFTSNYLGSTAFTANTTVNGNSSVIAIPRAWQFSTLAPAPATSPWVTQYGNSAAIDTMHVVVVDQGGLFTGVQGAVLEKYLNVSRAIDAQTVGGVTNYYKNVINYGSSYVYVNVDRANATSANSAAVTSSTNLTPLALQFNSGQDGLGEANIAFSDLANAYDLLQNPNVQAALVMQGKPVGGSTTINGQTVNNFQLANYLIDNLAENRKDLVLFITPDDAAVTQYPTSRAQSLVNWHGALHDTSYAVVDSGYKYMYDRYNNVYRYVPLNGDIAGLCARTEQTNDAWWSPAGFNRGQIKNIIRPRWNPSRAERDLLYPNGINPIVTFPGQGTILYGDRTSTLKPSAFDRINVRRLFIVLEQSIKKAAYYSLFEFNDEFTRSQFVNLVTPFLRDVQSRRGITDFLVKCDSENNTGQVIDSNSFVGDIYIKPNRSINFIQLNFVAVGTSVQFSTVVGKFG